MICPNCGREGGSKTFCMNCGSRLPAAPTNRTYNTNTYINITADNLPPQYRPLSAWAYFGLAILFSIPLIGFIFLIVYALSDANINRRSYARSYFCGLILVLIIVAVAAATGIGAGLVDLILNR